MNMVLAYATILVLSGLVCEVSSALFRAAWSTSPYKLRAGNFGPAMVAEVVGATITFFLLRAIYTSMARSDFSIAPFAATVLPILVLFVAYFRKARRTVNDPALTHDDLDYHQTQYRKTVVKGRLVGKICGLIVLVILFILNPRFE